MTNELRVKIMEKNKLGQEVSKNTYDLKLCKLYKQLKMRLHQPLETQKSRFIAMN